MITFRLKTSHLIKSLTVHAFLLVFFSQVHIECGGVGMTDGVKGEGALSSLFAEVMDTSTGKVRH